MADFLEDLQDLDAAKASGSDETTKLKNPDQQETLEMPEWAAISDSQIPEGYFSPVHPMRRLDTHPDLGNNNTAAPAITDDVEGVENSPEEEKQTDDECVVPRDEVLMIDSDHETVLSPPKPKAVSECALESKPAAAKEVTTAIPASEAPEAKTDEQKATAASETSDNTTPAALPKEVQPRPEEATAKPTPTQSNAVADSMEEQFNSEDETTKQAFKAGLGDSLTNIFWGCARMFVN